MLADINIMTISQFLGSGPVQAELGGIRFFLPSVGMGGALKILMSKSAGVFFFDFLVVLGFCLCCSSDINTQKCKCRKMILELLGIPA